MSFISSLWPSTMGGMRLWSNCTLMCESMESWSLIIQMCSMSNHLCLSCSQPYFFLKCTFSQTATDVSQKLMAYVPITITVMKIIVKELPYCSPDHNLELAKQLVSRDVILWDKWKPIRNALNALRPVITHRITWINIMVIKVHIWVQTRGNPIDISSTSTTNAQEYTAGVCPTYFFF